MSFKVWGDDKYGFLYLQMSYKSLYFRVVKFYISFEKMKRFGIIKRAYLWVILAICLGLWWAFVFLMTANYSEEFTGWVSISINTQTNAEDIQNNLKSFLSEKDYGKTTVHVNTTDEETQIKINADLKNDDVVAQLSTDISKFLIDKWYVGSTEDIIGQALTGPSVWDYMKTTAMQALIIWLVLMVIYMLLAFKEIRKYISPAVLSGVVLCVMLFDILATVWAYWVWMLINDTLQVDTIFIISVLTVIAYGINDVIVIFDRIRENMSRNKDKNVVYWRLFEDSVWQSVRRSIWTSISTLIVLVAMFFLWNSSVLQQFSFTVWMWIVFATLSSIFLWAPLAYLLMWKFSKEKWKF